MESRLDPAVPSPGRPAAEQADPARLSGVAVELHSPLLHQDPDEVSPGIERASGELEAGDFLLGQTDHHTGCHLLVGVSHILPVPVR